MALSRPPFYAALVDKSGRIGGEWSRYFDQLLGEIERNLAAGRYYRAPATKSESGDSLLPTPTAADTGQVPKVNAAGDGYDLADDEVGAPGSGEANVQADWDDADDTSDAHILHKPDIPEDFGDLAGAVTIAQLPIVSITKGGTGAPTAAGARAALGAAAAGDVRTDTEIDALVDQALNELIDGAPGALDTLNELAAAIGDDADYAASVTTALAAKAPIANPALTGAPTAPTAAAGTNTLQVATNRIRPCGA